MGTTQRNIAACYTVLTQKLWQNTIFLQLAETNDLFYAVVAV